MCTEHGQKGKGGTKILKANEGPANRKTGRKGKPEAWRKRAKTYP